MICLCRGVCALILKVMAILIEFLHVCFHADYPILHKLFKLCPLMERVLLHENRTEGFVLAHIHSPEIISFDIIFALSEEP